MIAIETKRISEVVRPGDIIVTHNKISLISKVIEEYERGTSNNKYPLYPSHVVQVYDNYYCIDQVFPFSKLTALSNYLDFYHEVLVIRPKMTEEETISIINLMRKDVGIVYDIIQLIGFIFQYISYKLFKKKVINYLDIKHASVCSSNISKRLKKISERFDLSKYEFKKNAGLVTPLDFIRVSQMDNNFEIIDGTGKFKKIL